MRISAPPIPREAPTNPRNSLAGRWYATINKSSSSSSNPDISRNKKSSHERSGAVHSVTQQQRQKEELTDNINTNNTLGNFLVHNHRAVNRVVRFDKLTKQPAIELDPTPSLSSGEDMRRAGMRYSLEAENSKKPFLRGPLHESRDDKPNTTRYPADISAKRNDQSQMHKQEKKTRCSSSNASSSHFKYEHHPQSQMKVNQKALPQPRDHHIEALRRSLDRISTKSSSFSAQSNLENSGATERYSQSHDSSLSTEQMKSMIDNVPTRHVEDQQLHYQQNNDPSPQYYEPNSMNEHYIDSNDRPQLSKAPQQQPARHFDADDSKILQLRRPDKDTEQQGAVNQQYRHSQAANTVEDDPIAIERERHAAQENRWGSVRLEEKEMIQYDPAITRYDGKPSQPARSLHENMYRPPLSEYQTKIIFSDGNNRLQQPSAFDAVYPNGYRVFPNVALADGNESLGSTNYPQDLHQFYQQHIVGHQPQPSTSGGNIQCSPNTSDACPKKQVSQPSATLSLVEQGKGILELLKPNFPIRACTPLGNLNEAIATEVDNKDKRKSIWAYLDPNDDLNYYYDDGSSEGSSGLKSPRKKQRSRRYRSHDHDNDISNKRYGQTKKHDSGHSRQNEDFGERIIEQRSRSRSRSPRDLKKNIPLSDSFSETALHNALWSPGNPDPIFSPSDVANRGTPDSRHTRYSTGNISPSNIRNHKYNGRKPGASFDGHQHLTTIASSRPQSQSTGRGSRVDELLQQLSKRKEMACTNKQDQVILRRRSRSQSKGRNDIRSKSPPHNAILENPSPSEKDFFSSANFEGVEDWPRNNERVSPMESPPFPVDFEEQDIPFGISYDEISDLKDDDTETFEEDRRLQKKLDNVRARSIRNVKKLQKYLTKQKKESERFVWSDANRYPRKPVVHEVDDQEDVDGHYMYVAYSRYGQDAQKVLQLCEHQSNPTPNSRQGEVLIRIQSSTISTFDCAIRRGEWPSVVLNPFIIPGVALVGKVQEPTEKRKRRSQSSFSYASPIQPGDTVLSLVPSGANARFSCLPKHQLVKVPPHVDTDKAVCLIDTYLTAFQVLHWGQKGGLRYREKSLKGRSILILGGYTALGKALIELSIAAGAEFCYASDNQTSSKATASKSTSQQERHFETMTKWGAIPLSHNPQDWLTLIGRQIDLMVTVYDPSIRGGALYNENISSDHWKALRKDGQAIVICMQPGLDKNTLKDDFFGHAISNHEHHHHSNGMNMPFRLSNTCRLSQTERLVDRTIWYNVFDSWENNKSSLTKKDLEHLLKLLETNQINPEVMERIPLSKVGKAQSILEHKRLTGHIICVPWLKQQQSTKNKNYRRKNK